MDSSGNTIDGVDGTGVSYALGIYTGSSTTHANNVIRAVDGAAFGNYAVLAGVCRDNIAQLIGATSFGYGSCISPTGRNHP
jgi:hypothetical protein